MILDKCAACDRFHPFNLVRVDSALQYFEWSCSDAAKKKVPLSCPGEGCPF
jgi:hypothetical protein